MAARQETSGSDVSRQGVQRDLLPLVEGTTVSTKYGMVKTDHILFIASGPSTSPSPATSFLSCRAFPHPCGAGVAVGEGLSRPSSPQTHASLVKQYQACWPPKG